MAPKLVYQGNCRFCAWAAKWADEHGEFEPLGFDQLTDSERARLPVDYEECAHIVTDETVYSRGEAVERALVHAGLLPGEVVEFLGQFEDYPRLREAVYHSVSERRDLLSTVVGEESPVRRYPDRER